MSTTRRRINSTGRKRIKREQVDIRLLESEAGQPLRAKASLDLSSQNFPGNAAVSIEAYHRASGMRFDCGTIEDLKIPPVLVLNEVDRSGGVLFRVKVVDLELHPGRVLGSAERLSPTGDEDTDGRKSLFPVQFADLGPEVWKVEIEPGDKPRLLLNREIPGISQKLESDALFQGLVLPTALRLVVEALVREPAEDDDDEPGWKTDWREFCHASLGMTDDPEGLSAEDQHEWVDRAVRSFCNLYGFMDSIRQMEVAPL
jgi:hypothetical protein